MDRTRRKNHFNNEYTVTEGVWRLRDMFVNVYFIQNTFDRRWFLVDTGLKRSAAKIKDLANKLFGTGSKPLAIILTHAHFDHVGSLPHLLEVWRVPVYAHFMEKPYLVGESAYPPPDPSVGGGLISFFSRMYPRGPINVEQHFSSLPADGSIPAMPEWRYIPTPGHAPGHISLFREKDRVLVAGDALSTVNSESASAMFFDTQKLCGPPKYFTYDWKAASESVTRLAGLKPEVIATGHGSPMQGDEVRRSLHNLSEHFWEVAVPPHGRYVKTPAAVDEHGVQTMHH